MDTLNRKRLTYSVLFFLTIGENFGYFFAQEHWSNFDLAFLKLTKSYRSTFLNAISWEPDFSEKIWEISHPEHTGTSSYGSQLSTDIRDWLLPVLYQVGKHSGIPERFTNEN